MAPATAVPTSVGTERLAFERAATTRLTPPFGIRMVGRDGDAPVRAGVPTALVSHDRRRSSILGRFGVQPLLITTDLTAALLGPLVVGRAVTLTSVLFAGTLVALYAMAHLYRSRLSMSVLDQVPALVGRWLAAIAITILMQAVLTQMRWDVDLVKWGVVYGALATLGLLLVLRTAAYAVVRSLRKQRRVAHRTLVLGAGRVGAQVADVLLDHPEYGLHPIGFLDSDPGWGRRSCRCRCSAAPTRSTTCSPTTTSTTWSWGSGRCASRPWST